MIQANKIRSAGYLVSVISVVLLSIASWSNAQKSALVMACLIGGALTSIVGMGCRWLSYEIEERRKKS